jgi:hypothetical protein
MTSKDHDDLGARLTAIADGPAPPTGIDAGRSIAEGTTRLRRRRTALVGAVAVVTAAVITTTALLAPGGGSATPAPPAGPVATTSPSPSASAAPTPVGFDPLTTEVHFGWLPDWAHGERSIGYETGYHGIYAQARGDGDDAPRILLSQYKAGEEPPMNDSVGDKFARVEAEPIDGRTAYYVVDDPSHRGAPRQPTLRWLTASGRWAEISGYGGKSGDVTQEVLHRAAQDVKFGTWKVPLPVQFTGLPEAFKATDVQLSVPDPDGAGAWSLWLMFQLDGKNVSVNMRPDGPHPTSTGTDGSPYTDPNPPLVTVQNGVEVSIGAGGGMPATLEQLGGLPWMLAHTRALGPDPSTWTTAVIR